MIHEFITEKIFFISRSQHWILS